MKRVVKTNIAVRFTVTCKKSLLKKEYNVNFADSFISITSDSVQSFSLIR